MVLGGRGVVLAETQGRHLFECSKPNCFRRLTFKTLEAAQHEEVSHPCPWWGGPTKVSWSVTKTLVQQMWDKLDTEYEQLVSSGDETFKHKARSTAECLAIFMPPFFTTSDEIVREAVKRYKAKQDGEEYETPGIGARRYESAALSPRERSPRKPTNQPTLAIHVDEQVKKAIKFALESGMFTVPELAKTYKLSEAVIELIKNS